MTDTPYCAICGRPTAPERPIRTLAWRYVHSLERRTLDLCPMCLDAMCVALRHAGITPESPAKERNE